MSAPRNRIETSLGYALEPEGSLWVLDLSDLPILHGLSVLSRALAEALAVQAKSEPFVIHVERRIRPRENPELLQRFGISTVKVHAGHECIARIADHPEACEHHLRALLGNLQRRRYREALLPGDGASPSRALVAEFSFVSEEIPSRFVLELLPSSHGRQAGGRHAEGRHAGCLSITIEDPRGRRLDLASIPHVLIEDLESRTFIAGSTRIAQTWSESLRREAERGRRTFVELKKPTSHLFQQFERAGLGGFERVALQWTDPSMPLILESEPHELEHALKRALLALEDRSLRSLLFDGEIVRVVHEESSVFLDVSQLGRVLNLSLGARRARSDVETFLARMPVLSRATEGGGLVPNAHAGPLADTSVFLVHHMTSEVVGLIAALRRLGCPDLTCLFVAYGSDEPPSYLEAILDLPSAEFRALSLVNVPSPGEVEGHYRLSSRYSPLAEGDEIRAALARHGRPFVEAMRAAALPAFLRQLATARAAGRRLLVVEDGGYLAPLLNRASLEKRTLRSLLADFGLASEDDRTLAAALEDVLIGTVEHTRSGFDRLAEIEAQHGRLAFPAFSIAVSRLKVETEAKEVAVSILNAVESVLHASGKILSRRRALVLGSRGAIGGSLVNELLRRLEDPARQLLGLDLAVEPGPDVERGSRKALASSSAPGSSTSAAKGQRGFNEARRFNDLPPEDRLAVDLVLGVTGASVLQGVELEEWLAHGEGRELVLASGSSKTIEFTDLAHWLDGLLKDPRPTLAGEPVEIRSHEVSDPRTGRVYGRRYAFAVPGRAPNEVVFLANLTPVNFLFYGVPTELIDEVLAQLVSCSLGLVRRAAREKLPARLHAVDRDITPDGELLASRAPAGARSPAERILGG